MRRSYDQLLKFLQFWLSIYCDTHLTLWFELFFLVKQILNVSFIKNVLHYDQFLSLVWRSFFPFFYKYGPVVRKTFNSNPWLKVNRGFYLVSFVEIDFKS